MSILGRNNISVSKIDLFGQKSLGVAAKTLVFAHQCTQGDLGLSLSSLTAPTIMVANGFVNPSTSDLAAANILFFRKNLKLWSSVRGDLKDFLSYAVASSTQINFLNFYQSGTGNPGAEDGEIIVGEMDAAPLTGALIVDSTFQPVTGTVAANATDINVGTPFEINKFSAYQIGAVLVFLDGGQLFRNTGNSSTNLDGNYYEIAVGGGLGNVIRLNASENFDRSYVVLPTQGYCERPTGSMLAVMEAVNGKLNNMAPYLADAVGEDVATVLGATPSDVDLKQFGDRVVAAEADIANTQSSLSDSIARTDPFFIHIRQGWHPAAPTDITTIVSNVVTRLTTAKNIYTGVPTQDNKITPTGTYPGGGAFIGGVLLPDGRVFCVPQNSTSARIYNPVTDTLSTPTGTYPGGGAFVGGVLLPDGRVFCLPYNSTSARIYNPVTDTLSTPTGTYPGSVAFVGGVLLPDGRVFCVPSNSTSARIYNPATDTLSTPTGTYPGTGAFQGGVLLPDGRVFCIPNNSTSARIYNPVTDTLSTPTGTYPGASAFVGGVLLPDGRVFCIPNNSTSGAIAVGNYSFYKNFSKDDLLGPFLNKY